MFLFIDTITNHASLSLCQKGKTVSLPFGEMRSRSRELILVFDGLLKKAKITPEDIEGIYVLKGPGSYTSIRIGVSFANTLAHSLGVPLCGVTLFEALVLHEPEADLALFDAGHGNAFFAQNKKVGLKSYEDIQKTNSKDMTVSLELTAEHQKLLKAKNIKQLDIEKLFGGLQEQGRLPKESLVEPFYVLPPNISKSKKPKYF